MTNETGIVKTIDKLGRIVLPKEMLLSQGLSPGDLVEVKTFKDESGDSGFVIRRSDMDTRNELMEVLQKLRISDPQLFSKLSEVVKEHIKNK